ncbi:MAG: D-aminoacyl-tRNA deacylase, partial [Oscillospiraceae bacterium]
MRCIIQRVSFASVSINEKQYSKIEKGLCVFLGVSCNDDEKAAAFLAEKVCNLRIFEDEAGKMNLSLLDIDGEILVISQFTLFADCSHGRRPSFF